MSTLIPTLSITDRQTDRQTDMHLRYNHITHNVYILLSVVTVKNLNTLSKLPKNEYIEMVILLCCLLTIKGNKKDQLTLM